MSTSSDATWTVIHHDESWKRGPHYRIAGVVFWILDTACLLTRHVAGCWLLQGKHSPFGRVFNWCTDVYLFGPSPTVTTSEYMTTEIIVGRDSDE